MASRSSFRFVPVALGAAVLVGCPLPSASIGDLADTSSTTGMSGDPDSGPSSSPTADGPSDTGSDDVPSDSSATETSPESSSGSETTGVGASCAEDLPASTADECSVYAQDCPACYRCTWPKNENGEATNQEQPVCLLAPEDGVALGELCTIDTATGNDDCAIGSFCYPPAFGEFVPRCVSFCTGGDEFACAVPDTFCVGSSGAGEFGCFDACDPLLQDCNPSEICALTYPTGDGYACYPSGADPRDLVDVMGECFSSFECLPGLVCIEADHLGPACTSPLGCCSPLCDATDGGSQAECQAIDPALDCVSGCEFGSPPGYEHVGGCFVDEPTPGLCEPPGIDDTYPWCSGLNNDACGEPGDFGGGNECNDFCHCYLPCDDASECDVPPTGNATPECILGEVGESNTCVLECDDGQTCPDGMVCSDMWSPSRCMWATPTGQAGC